MAAAFRDREVHRTHRSTVWRQVRAIGGILLLGLGLLGLVIPVIPGVPLLLAGVALIGKDHPLVRPVVGKLRQLRARWRRFRRAPARR
jgi:uncharacterized membrane protein YbaN (DUF454 family)